MVGGGGKQGAKARTKVVQRNPYLHCMEDLRKQTQNGSVGSLFDKRGYHANMQGCILFYVNTISGAICLFCFPVCLMQRGYHAQLH